MKTQWMLAPWGLSALLITQTAFAKPHTPAPGSAERKAIMDAMRKVVGKPHKKPIIFTADHLKVENGWAYFGGRFDYVDKSRVSADFGWGNLSCLLRYENKAWRVKRFIHNTDVAEPDYIEMFPQAPRAIFQRKYR